MTRGVPIALCVVIAVQAASGQRGAPATPSSDAPPQFTNVAPAAGVDFRHVNGGTPDRHLLEIVTITEGKGVTARDDLKRTP